jgi:hypothetical protein
VNALREQEKENCSPRLPESNLLHLSADGVERLVLPGLALTIERLMKSDAGRWHFERLAAKRSGENPHRLTKMSIWWNLFFSRRMTQSKRGEPPGESRFNIFGEQRLRGSLALQHSLHLLRVLCVSVGNPFPPP